MHPLYSLPLETPALVYDHSYITAIAKQFKAVQIESGLHLLYSVKALPFLPILSLISPWVDGFSVSSLNEARLVSNFNKPLHITTPGLREGEFPEISERCRYIAFNSLQQYQRLAGKAHLHANLGLRINPGISTLADPRFDPCRPHSKLGIPLAELTTFIKSCPSLRNNIKGIHFHTLFSTTTFKPLANNIEQIRLALGHDFLDNLEWFNLGGGVILQHNGELSELINLVLGLSRDYGVKIFIEPGKAWVDKAGFLVGTIIDQFQRDGEWILVLDTTVNHHPEIFEYQKRPVPAWDEPELGFSAFVVGSTCMAGDIFGQYRFERLPKIGDNLVFAELGAYGLVKAHRFNGYELPSLYFWDGLETVTLMKRDDYDAYARHWTADAIG